MNSSVSYSLFLQPMSVTEALSGNPRLKVNIADLLNDTFTLYSQFKCAVDKYIFNVRTAFQLCYPLLANSLSNPLE